MKEILVLAVLCAMAYFFRNYQTFGEANLRPLAVQWNWDREGNPQVLCDLLAPTAEVKIDDKFPRLDKQFTGYKEEACKYFNEAATFFAKPYIENNGYILDRLSKFEITNVDYLRGEAEVQYSWESSNSQTLGLQTNKGNMRYIGKTTTKMKLRLKPFEDLQATYYEFFRRFEAIAPK